MLFIFVAQADGAPSCHLLCCCLRSWDDSGGTAVNSAAGTVAGLPLLLTRCFFVSRFFVLFARRRTSPFPSSISEASPAGFGLPRPQTHQDHDGKGIYFFWREESKFLKTVFRKHSNSSKFISGYKNIDRTWLRRELQKAAVLKHKDTCRVSSLLFLTRPYYTDCCCIVHARYIPFESWILVALKTKNTSTSIPCSP